MLRSSENKLEGRCDDNCRREADDEAEDAADDHLQRDAPGRGSSVRIMLTATAEPMAIAFELC